MDEGSWLSYLIIILLLLCAAYFAAAETAFASVSRIHIKTRMERGQLQARRALYVLDNFDRAITTILIGTNVTHIAVAALVTVMVTRRWGVNFVTLSTILMTVVIFFAGEMLPKSVGKKYSERISLAFSTSLCALMKLLFPLSKLLSLIGGAAARLTRGDPEVTVTEDELYDIIENMKDEGELDQEQGELVHSALMFADVTVESVLTARVDVQAIDVEDSPREILDFIVSQKHSRLPVYRDSIDNIIGVLQIRKYIKAYRARGEAVDIASLLDEAYFVHQSTNIDELLRSMSRKKLNMAIVTDNYGGTLGIVTVEDILEELVGEIWDEDDEVVENFTPLPDGSFLLDPELDMEESFELVGFEDPEDTDWEHKLIGEWAYENFSGIPREGERFCYHNLEVTVERMRQQRILKLRLRLLPQPSDEEGGERS